MKNFLSKIYHDSPTKRLSYDRPRFFGLDIYHFRQSSILVDLSVTSLSVSAMLLIKYLLYPIFDSFRYPFILGYIPLVFSAWYGGFRAGIFTTVLGIFAVDYFFYPPLNRVGITTPVQLSETLLYLSEGVLISLLAETLHRSLYKLENNAKKLYESIIVQKEADEKVKEHLNLLNTVIESISDAVFVKDLKGKYTLINTAGAAFIGRNQNEIIGKHASDLFPAETVKQINQSEEMVLKTKSPIVYDEIIKSRNGATLVCLSTKSIYRGAEGEVAGFVGVSHDITDRKRYEEKLEELNKKITNILESITDAFFALDKDGRFIYLNRQAEKLLGVSGQMVVGRSVWEEFPEIIDPEFYRKYLRVIATKESVKFEKYYTPYGKYFEIHAYPSKDGLSVYFNDVTERREAEDALRENEERFRLLAESVPQIIWTAKTDGNIDYFNKKWYEYTGLTPHQSVGKEWREVVHPEDEKKNHKVWLESIKTGKLYETEARLRREKDKIYRWHLIRALPIKNRNDKIVKWFGTSTDIDDQKKLDERKDEFISTASHELKTPITTIKAFTQLLQTRFDEKKFPEVSLYLYKMNYQINRLKTLINDLLDDSKIKSGKLEYIDKEFDIDELIKETVEDIQPTTSTHKIHILDKVRRILYADRYRIGQVLTNLISNAIKYSPNADMINIHVKSISRSVTIGVEDFGIGIAQDEVGKIFNRFYRINGSGGERFEGMGLGLHISAEIIKRHKGKIWAESVEGEGSTFYITIPLFRRKEAGVDKSSNINISSIYEKTSFSN